INSKKFKTHSMPKDPRYFDDRALTPKNNNHYTDFDEENSIDLLSPKFDIDKVNNKISRSHLLVRDFVKSILDTNTISKFANQDIRTEQGVNVNLFNSYNWVFINQLINEINIGLHNLS